MPVVTPLPQFAGLSEAEVLKALADPDETNPIACEVARLLTGYAENFRAHVERLGHFPEQIIHAKPGSPIEAVAMRLMNESIQAEIASPRGNA